MFVNNLTCRSCNDVDRHIPANPTFTNTLIDMIGRSFLLFLFGVTTFSTCRPAFAQQPHLDEFNHLLEQSQDASSVRQLDRLATSVKNLLAEPDLANDVKLNSYVLLANIYFKQNAIDPESLMTYASGVSDCIEGLRSMYEQTAATNYGDNVQKTIEFLEKKFNVAFVFDKPFEKRMTGVWVTSITDQSGAPGMILYVDCSSQPLAYISSDCKLANSSFYTLSKAVMNFNSRNVAYSPQKRFVSVSFGTNMVRRGNLDLADNLSKTADESSARTTESIAMSNRNNPLSGGNIAGQVASEATGRLAQGIARELAVSKNYIITTEINMYEILPGVAFVKLTCTKFLERSDELRPQLEDYESRSFFMFKINTSWALNDRIISNGGKNMTKYPGLKNEYADLLDQEARIRYNAQNYENLYGQVNAAWDWVVEATPSWAGSYSSDECSLSVGGYIKHFTRSEVLQSISDRLKTPWFITVDIPKMKDVSYTGEYRLNDWVGFLDHPTFLIDILSSIRNGELYSGDQREKQYKRHSDLLRTAIIPVEGKVKTGRKNGYVSYEGTFKNGLLDGEVKVFNASGSLKGVVEYKNGKPKK